MKVAVVRDFDKPLSIEEWPDPEPVGEEVVVTVEAAGMCHTDLHLLKWKDRQLPLVMGHEIAGWTEKHGHVLVHQSWGCGKCGVCSRGEEQLCPDVTEAGFERPGGYAEKVLVPSEKYLLPLNGLSPWEAAPLTDAGATSYRAVRRALPYLTAGSRVLVIGVGALGQFAVQFLRLLTGCQVIAVDVSYAKRQKALELGAHDAIAPDEVDLQAAAVFDFVSENDTLELAASHVQIGGLIVSVGSGSGHLRFGAGSNVPLEVNLTTARGGSRDDVRAVLAYAQRGELAWTVELIALDNVNEGLDRLRRGEVDGRLILTP